MLRPTQTANGDGSRKNFTVIGEILSSSHLRIWINGTIQSSEDWDLNGNVVLFHTAPVNGSDIVFQVSTTGNDFPNSPTSFDTVAAHTSEVDTVAGKINQLLDIYDKLSEIDTVSNYTTEMVAIDVNMNRLNAVHSSLSDINLVAAHMSKVRCSI